MYCTYHPPLTSQVSPVSTGENLCCSFTVTQINFGINVSFCVLKRKQTKGQAADLFLPLLLGAAKLPVMWVMESL